ncbi:hypothetical protein Tco_0772949 [Tanacetum coccineum]|uniref:CCHC-type domain-containing protein n=1 Tax=Tanacetum coccineum TaxID=301880 RepID=A0ABQ4ZJC2_9ASTR
MVSLIRAEKFDQWQGTSSYHSSLVDINGVQVKASKTIPLHQDPSDVPFGLFEETHESMPTPVVNEPKVVSQPKVWSDAPIIEEYESDSEDEHVSLPTEEQETPSFANKQVKTPRETVKNQFTHSKSPKPDKKDCSGLISKKLGLGYGFTIKACFVCGSLSHLIRDCDFHEKMMAKQVELNKQKGKGNVQRENKPVWNNVQRVNHKNQFVPTSVLTRTGKIPVVSTARHNFNSQAVLTNVARKISTVKPFVNKTDTEVKAKLCEDCSLRMSRRILVISNLREDCCESMISSSPQSFLRLQSINTIKEFRLMLRRAVLFEFPVLFDLSFVHIIERSAAADIGGPLLFSLRAFSCQTRSLNRFSGRIFD